MEVYVVSSRNGVIIGVYSTYDAAMAKDGPVYIEHWTVDGEQQSLPSLDKEHRA